MKIVKSEKRQASWLAGGALVLGLAVGISYALDRPQSAAGHRRIAAALDQNAREQDALINKHEEMKKEYRDSNYINDKMTPPANLGAEENRHNEIIESAERRRNEYRDSARWHELRALDLQGR